jgi:peptidoglycan/xylan/chitin deacetylase (PgdA/CDA1 family)
MGTPILTYHKIKARPAGARLKGLYLDPGLLDLQLQELKSEGFQSQSLGQLPLKLKKRFIITFDDGFKNVLENAADILARHQCKAIQFLVADRIGMTNTWETSQGEISEPLMNQREVEAWRKQGHEIGSHTLTHPFLTKLSREDATTEIADSKHKLEDMFGVPVRHFCYPYGDWNPEISELVMEAGYATACTTEFGINQPTEAPFTLKRVTARYPSRNWKNFKHAVRRFFAKK